MSAGTLIERAVKAEAEVKRLRRVLGTIAELADRCEDCDATHATHVTTSSLGHFLCADCAKLADEQYRKAESKGCGKHPRIEEHEQDLAVRLALAALGEGLSDASSSTTSPATGATT